MVTVAAAVGAVLFVPGSPVIATAPSQPRHRTTPRWPLSPCITNFVPAEGPQTQCRGLTRAAELHNNAAGSADEAVHPRAVLGDLCSIRAGRHVDHSVGGLSQPNLHDGVGRLASKHANTTALELRYSSCNGSCNEDPSTGAARGHCGGQKCWPRWTQRALATRLPGLLSRASQVRILPGAQSYLVMPMMQDLLSLTHESRGPLLEDLC
jgi:hypothetical protein